MMRVAIFASGRGTNFENIVDRKIGGCEIVLLITDKNCPALKIAEDHGIEARTFLRKTFESKTQMEQAIITSLEEKDIDLIVLAGYMRLLSSEFVARYEKRIINIHPSFLPHYKGTHAIEQAFEDGRGIYGVTVHYVNEGMDEGEIIEQVSLTYDGNDLDELESMVHAAEYELYPRVIQKLITQEKAE